jgi:hypothetical protein
MDAQAKKELHEFYQALATHDWYYAMSEDQRVWRAGDDNARRLTQWAAKPPARELKTALYYAYTLHKFSGHAFGTEPQPRPVDPCPEEGDENGTSPQA